MFEPVHLKLWTMPANYSAGVGQSRDSDALERSNFACMLAALGGEDGEELVTVVREGHWAVGWVEWIAIHQDAEDELQIADEIKGRLEDYPVIDDDDYSEREQQDADETWANCYSPQERIAYIRRDRSQFKFHDMADLLGCVRGRYFAGDASDLLY